MTASFRVKINLYAQSLFSLPCAKLLTQCKISGSSVEQCQVGPGFLWRKSRRGWSPKEAKALRQMFLSTNEALHRLISGKEANASTSCMKLTDRCQGPLGTGWQHLAERASVPLWFSTQAVPTARGVSRLRYYDDHDVPQCGEFNLMICLAPSTSDLILTRSGQKESRGSILRPSFSQWTCPSHTWAVHSFSPDDLDPNGVISQWPEMTLFQDVCSFPY